MPRTYSSIEKIRAELAWVTETADPKNTAAVTCDAVKRLDISAALGSREQHSSS
jgi:hypothetical protein